MDFAFAHKNELCSPFPKRVHAPNALYDAYDESDDTEQKTDTSRAWEDKRLRVSEQLQCACCCLTLTAVGDVQMKYFEYKKESMKAEVFKT